MRYLLLILIFCLFLVPAVAQDEAQSPYEIALERIEEARTRGARYLDLADLGLTELPQEIGSLEHLEELDLANNLLTALPPEIGNLVNLGVLYLESNQLSSLPPEIGNLSNLRVLFLSKNLLTALPPEIGNLVNLTDLNLENNELSSLPPEIGNLENLIQLRLSSNELQTLPPEIGKLSNLCELRMVNNPIQSLPSELGTLEGLAEWDCQLMLGNSFGTIPPEVASEGTAAILEYLRNEAWWHLQRLIAGGAGFVGLVAAILLGIRWRSRTYGKKKKNS
jgi:internalin A